MRISDWSSDVCSSDLSPFVRARGVFSHRRSHRCGAESAINISLSGGAGGPPRLMYVAGRISDRDIAAIRERTRIEDIVGEYVSLKRAGGDSIKGLCPFHDEKSPSFHVRPNHGLYHCFGCGEGGAVYSFLQKLDHTSFLEAVERLADSLQDR